jgi:RNA polymerase sigma factor (sigma-70 family)
MHQSAAPSTTGGPIPDVLEVLEDLALAGTSADAAIAFEVVHRQVDARLRRYLMHSFGDRIDDHQDWIHDFYVALPRKARSFREGSWDGFVAWCVRVLQNDVLLRFEDERRRGERSLDLLLEDSESNLPPTPLVAHSDDAGEPSGQPDESSREGRRISAVRWVRAAMSRFSEQQRRVLAIVLTGGTVADAARALGLTPRQAAKLRENALKRFKNIEKPKIERFV